MGQVPPCWTSQVEQFESNFFTTKQMHFEFPDSMKLTKLRTLQNQYLQKANLRYMNTPIKKLFSGLTPKTIRKKSGSSSVQYNLSQNEIYNFIFQWDILDPVNRMKNKMLLISTLLTIVVLLLEQPRGSFPVKNVFFRALPDWGGGPCPIYFLA